MAGWQHGVELLIAPYSEPNNRGADPYGDNGKDNLANAPRRLCCETDFQKWICGVEIDTFAVLAEFRLSYLPRSLH
jgi:hypothetical protein